MTPHINAKKEDIANVVIMPGDPLRAKWIAENFLKNVVQVNSIRGMLAFTGTYNDKKITIMGHGMGIASIGIYSYELFKFYDVDLIIRVGSAGTYVRDIKLGDVLIVENAYSDSTYAEILGVDVKNKMIPANEEMVDLAFETSKQNGIEAKKINCHSSDVFYSNLSPEEWFKKSSSEVVEMESFGLFANAIILNKKSLCLLTCSDSLVTHESMPAEERQIGFSKMVKLSLDIGVNFYEKKF
ncbi:MAG: purine-nucleoside phosphorylase [Mycoplasmoidaceae bacterium]